MSYRSALLFPKGIDVIPEPILVDGFRDIQKYIGGCFDVVTMETTDSDDNDVVLVGYVHDEGILLNMEPNWLASALFQRELFGDVVVVSGLNPDGLIDGDDYDLPSNIAEYLQTEFVEHCAAAYNSTIMTSLMIKNALDGGFITEEELENFDMELSRSIGSGVELSQQAQDFLKAIQEWNINNFVNHLVERESLGLDEALEKILTEAEGA